MGMNYTSDKVKPNNLSVTGSCFLESRKEIGPSFALVAFRISLKKKNPIRVVLNCDTNHAVFNYCLEFAHMILLINVGRPPTSRKEVIILSVTVAVRRITN